MIRPTRTDTPSRAAVCLVFLSAAFVSACSDRSPGSASSSQALDSRAAAEVQAATLNFANFADEIGPTTLVDFRRQTGISVNYELYESNLALEAKLLVGRTGLDLVVPGNNFLERQIKAGVYRPLDRSKLTNWKNLDPVLLAKLERNDPGNRYAVPYLWGTTSLGYDVDKVEAALGGPAPDSWALLFDPRYAAKLKECGIAVLDSPWLMIGSALLYLGRDPNSESPADLADALKVLMAIRPYVRNITTMPMSGPLAEGEYCVAVAPSADFRTARDTARATGRNLHLRYLIPREGAIMWIDTLAILVDAPHPDNALRMMDFLLRPEVIAQVTNAIYFANANAAASPLVAEDVRRDPWVYPTPQELARLHMNGALSDGYTRLQNREFTKFRTGQ